MLCRGGERGGESERESGGERREGERRGVREPKEIEGKEGKKKMRIDKKSGGWRNKDTKEFFLRKNLQKTQDLFLKKKRQKTLYRQFRHQDATPPWPPIHLAVLPRCGSPRCVCACVCKNMYVRVYVYICVCVYVYVYMCMYVYVCVYVCMYVCM